MNVLSMRRTDIGKRRLVQALKRGVERGRLFCPPLRVGVGKVCEGSVAFNKAEVAAF